MHPYIIDHENQHMEFRNLCTIHDGRPYLQQSAVPKEHSDQSQACDLSHECSHG